MVPEEWQLLWAGPSSVEAYIREFSYRARAAVARLEKATQIGYMPAEVDLRSLVQPTRAIWALRAHSLARLNVPPDRLVLVGTWDAEESSVDVLLVSGLRVCGCEVRSGSLIASPAHAPPHTPAPKLALRFSTQQSEDSAPVEGTINIPVYSNETREDLLFTVRTPLSRDFTRDAALLNAVALFVAPLD